jgi:hypothetical protein
MVTAVRQQQEWRDRVDESSVRDALITIVIRQNHVRGFDLYNQEIAILTGDQDIESSRRQRLRCTLAGNDSVAA